MDTQKSNVIQMHVNESSPIHQGNIARGILKRLMAENNHTMSYVSHRSGLSLMLIAEFLNGRIRNLSIRNLDKIARCYGLSSDELKIQPINHLTMR